MGAKRVGAKQFRTWVRKKFSGASRPHPPFQNPENTSADVYLNVHLKELDRARVFSPQSMKRRDMWEREKTLKNDGAKK